MNRNKDLQRGDDMNGPDTTSLNSKKRLRNPLCNDDNDSSGDEEDSTKCDSSDKPIQILLILFPPTKKVDIQYEGQSVKGANDSRTGE